MADPKDPPADPPADPKPDPKPAADPKPAPPPTVAQVKNTPLKHPSVIALEKKVSELEDKTDNLEAGLTSLNSFLEDLKIGGPSPVDIKHKGPSVPKGGFFDDMDKFIWGTKES